MRVSNKCIEMVKETFRKYNSQQIIELVKGLVKEN